MRLEENSLSEQVLDAVKRDDLKAFNDISQKDNRCFLLCFGRFPMLSLCYLFGAKKIAAEHEKRFLESEVFDENGVTAAEPPDAYKILKECAGTNLRLYASAFVSPAEALALTSQTDTLKQKFIQLNPSEKARENILKIYAARGKAARLENGMLRVAGEGLKKHEKMFLAALSGVAALFIAVFCVLTALINLNIGLGTKKNPTKINTVAQLLAAAESDAEYILLADLRLPLGFEIADFKGSLDGGGHSIIASDTAFARTVSGSIKNLKYTPGSQSTSQKLFAAEITGRVENIQYNAGEFALNASADFAFFALKNTGTVSNVTVNLNVKITDALEADLSGAALILDNRGEIKDCSVSGLIELTGNGAGDFSFAAIAATNSGKITNSQTLTGTQIKADTADLAGIAIQNLDGGCVENCVNNALLRQSAARQKWNPIAAGIAMTNGGTITDCVNKGEVNSISSNTNPEPFLSGDSNVLAAVYASGIVHENLGGGVLSASQNNAAVNAYSYVNNTFSAGIAAVNSGEIKGCINSGDVLSKAAAQSSMKQNPDLAVFAAGIVGINSNASFFSPGRIEKCKNSGDVTVSSYINRLYAAGIAGYSDGEITNNGSTGNIICVSAAAATVFMGGIIAECGGGDINNNYSAGDLDVSQVKGDNICCGGVIGFAYASRSGQDLYLQMYSIEGNYYVKHQNIFFGIGQIYIDGEGWAGGTDYKADAADRAAVLQMIAEI